MCRANKGLMVICSYCKKMMAHGPSDNISHGICRLCTAKFFWMGGLSKKEIDDILSKDEEVSHAEV